MNYKILFSGKNKKKISKCFLLKFLARVLMVNNFTKSDCDRFFNTVLCRISPKHAKS